MRATHPIDTVSVLPTNTAASVLSDKELADVAEQLPPVLSIMWRLLGVLEDPNSDVDDIARLIRVDTVLATQVLRLANSPHYGLAEPVGTVENAIQHTGVDEVARLVTTLSTREMFNRPLSYYGVSDTLLWQHTLAVAVASEIVAQRFLSDSDLAYTAGLLHPLGMAALDAIATTRKLPPRDESMPLLDWERTHFGATNAEIGARVLRFWNFPENLADALAKRYTPPRQETIGRPGNQLYLASCLVNKIPAFLPAEHGLFSVAGDLLASVGLSPKEIPEMEMETLQHLNHLKALLKLAS